MVLARFLFGGCALLICPLLVRGGTHYDEATINNKVIYMPDEYEQRQLEESYHANSTVVLHRHKRAVPWGAIISGAVSLFGKLFGGDQSKAMAQMYEKQMAFQLEQLCLQICVTQWSSWTPCTKPCGGGTRNRERKNQMPGKCAGLKSFTCPHGLKQQEVCNPGCPNGGQPSAKGCTCVPGWTGTCCNQKVTCKYPGKPKNGKVYGTWPALYSGVATFSCDDGYSMGADDQDTLTCQNDGTWTNDEKIPTCTRIKCSMPPEAENIQIMNRQGFYVHGEQVVYRCAEGYVIQGPETRTCIKHEGNTGKWTGFNPSCRAVDCGDPGLPINGERNGTSFRYKDKVSFSCAQGFKLLGSQSVECLANGKWLGKVPECAQIQCDAPFAPKNGNIRLRRKSVVGTYVTFSCDDGFVMEGPRVLQCQQDGNWNGTEPVCKAASCGDPGIPKNGAKDGSVYYFPYNVTYFCYTGYVLKGASQISCQANGQWSSTKPTCEPCTNNTYMDDLDKPGVCQDCPKFTYTLTEASTSKRQCICKKGYEGLPGGPCTEIKCEKLYAPMNGSMDDCDNKMGSTCTVECDDGFFIDKGTSVRTCQENGEWDGTAPHCSACPVNTYKADSRSCLPCPVDSHTEGTGNMKSGCTCNAGFSGPAGGPCTDINECEENGGKGPCEDTCENRKGGYKCGCSIPGYKLKDDEHTCYVAKQCKNITKEEAPDNGGVVCHWYREENSQQCGVRCNLGFEFPSRVNNYETCGPTTGYIWSFKQEDPNAVIPGCIPEFFPGYQTESKIYYFVTACQDLTEEQKRAVYENFKTVLDENGVCKRRASKVCNIADMGIICGKRTKRALSDGRVIDISQANIGFKIESLKVGEDPRKDCPRICQFLRIPSNRCEPSLCISAYKRFIKAAVVYSRTTLRQLYTSASQRNRMKFTAADRLFQPSNKRPDQGNVEIECKPGMKGDAEEGMCAPCEAGTFLHPTRKECLPCPPGTYMPFKGQQSCLPCPLGSTTTKPGSMFCHLCPEGYYGKGCQQRCQCVHGGCNVQTGHCDCKSGWEGARCDQDIDGCAAASCYPGVRCIDVKAPGTGFSCGPCPRGYTGDGAKCTKT